VPTAIQVRAETGDWPRLRHFVQDWCGARALPAEDCATLLIMLEELHTNLVKYAWDAGVPRGSMWVSLALQDGQVVLDLADDGRAFDPLAHAADHVGHDAQERPVGGLGLHLIQQLAHGASYWRADGRNHLRLARQVGAGLTATG
jgi:anti-sigma regulatory factor (Ser/Thr protein kinase)